MREKSVKIDPSICPKCLGTGKIDGQICDICWGKDVSPCSIIKNKNGRKKTSSHRKN